MVTNIIVLIFLDYEQIVMRDPDDTPQYAATGNGIAIMSNRISWFYDLRGPSMTLDTGCSASLVGVHLACQSIRTGESTLVRSLNSPDHRSPSLTIIGYCNGCRFDIDSQHNAANDST
jgi:3-oxoacyl-(acyl-carrier-protein) synthase